MIVRILASIWLLFVSWVTRGKGFVVDGSDASTKDISGEKEGL